MEIIKVNKVKKGEFIKMSFTTVLKLPYSGLRAVLSETGKVYVRGAWVTNKDGGWSDGKGRYSCQDVDDMNKEVFVKGDKLVVVGFTF